jgi:hypothetical protein
MNKIIATIIGIFFGLMPFWMTFVISPLWPVRTRKITILVLITLNILFWIFIIFKANLTPGVFGDPYVPYFFYFGIFIFLLLLIFRAYQLWPKREN